MSSSDCEAKKVPHALLIPLPAQGHMNPMMQLAWKLVSDGFLITFLNTDVNHQRILKANKDTNMQSNNDKIRMIYVPGGLSTEVVSRENQTNGASMFFGDVEKTLGPCVIDKVIREINDKYEDQKITCMIADVWTCFDLHTVAELHHITLVVLQTSLVSTFAIRYFSPKLVSLGLVPSDGVPMEDKIQQYLPSMLPLKSAHLS